MGTDEKPENDKVSSQEGLKQKVLKNLLQSGFPFEARIARALANLDMDDGYKEYFVTNFGDRPLDMLGNLNRGVPVACGVPYLDPVTNKSRELDIHSIIPLDYHGTDLWINFLIQCKNTNKIWTFGHYGLESVPTIKDKYVNLGIDFKSPDFKYELELFHPDPVVAIDPHFLCGIGRVLNTHAKDDEKNKDEIYEACVSAISAARCYQGTAVNLMKQSPQDWKGKKVLLYIPMVATGNKMFFADLSKDKPEVREVDEAFYIYQGLAEDGGKTHYTVPIATENSLPRLVNAMVNASVRFLVRFFAI